LKIQSLVARSVVRAPPLGNPGTVISDIKKMECRPPDLSLRINRIQSYLGFPKSEFPELKVYGGTGWVDEELTAEEKELDENEQNMDTGTSFKELLEDDW